MTAAPERLAALLFPKSGLADAGSVGGRLRAAGAAALAARLAAHDRNRHAGDAVLLHLDIAEQAPVGRRRMSVCSLAVPTFWRKHGVAVAERLELDGIEIERNRGRRRDRLDLDIAGRRRRCCRTSVRGPAARVAKPPAAGAHAQAPGVLIVPSSFLSLSEASRMPSVSWWMTSSASPVLAHLQELVDEILAGLQRAQAARRSPCARSRAP